MPYIITLFLACVVLSAAKAAIPGVPSIDWSDRNYALVKIDHEATSYEKLIKSTSNVEVPVSWNVWSGDSGDVAYVLFDGVQMYKGDAGVKKATVNASKGANTT
uniref:Putative truncated chitinase n=1 Tax=Spodoptera frugiperda nuclear polyhedrosis virus TaxID=10455 RepID=E5CYJ8_NPVSF|nr:putative truncated chitinase [Spodoptera frugiperda multiple nucleopolyhedrovirus]